MQFDNKKCECCCPECPENIFPVLEKKDFYTQGLCHVCYHWILESEINECFHCKQCREAFQNEMQQAAKKIEIKPLQSCPNCENISDTKCEC